MPRTNYTQDRNGSITVPNLSAYWLPEFTVREVIRGTTYIVTGSYEGREPFSRKLERILSERFTDNTNECAKNDAEQEL